jgi:hypothetical protein
VALPLLLATIGTVLREIWCQQRIDHPKTDKDLLHDNSPERLVPRQRSERSRPELDVARHISGDAYEIWRCTCGTLRDIQDAVGWPASCSAI